MNANDPGFGGGLVLGFTAGTGYISGGLGVAFLGFRLAMMNRNVSTFIWLMRWTI